jgi:cytochrome c biogenesis protein CcmG/thiol:disulfide interchange protein DsbE
MSHGRRRAIVLLILAAITALMLGGGAWFGIRASRTNAAGRAVHSPLLHHRAPAFELVRLDGGGLSLYALRGRIVVLNFWASWCIPCRAEAPLLEQASRRWIHRGVDIVGIATGDTPQGARQFRSKFKLAYPQVSDDGQNSVAAAYGLRGVPATIVIDEHGTVRGTILGQLHGSMLDDALRAVREGKSVTRRPFGPLDSGR